MRNEYLRYTQFCKETAAAAEYFKTFLFISKCLITFKVFSGKGPIIIIYCHNFSRMRRHLRKQSIKSLTCSFGSVYSTKQLNVRSWLRFCLRYKRIRTFAYNFYFIVIKFDSTSITNYKIYRKSCILDLRARFIIT
jgi:hypothetical protein